METFTDIWNEIGDNVKLYQIDCTKSDWSDNHICYILNLEYLDGMLTGIRFHTCRCCANLNAKDVLESIVVDVRSVYQQSFEEFCDNHGYNNDSIKDKKIYDSCCTLLIRLACLVNEKLFKRFMECEM